MQYVHTLVKYTINGLLYNFKTLTRGLRNTAILQYEIYNFI